MNYTENLGLAKPEATDLFSAFLPNAEAENMDIIDEKVSYYTSLLEGEYEYTDLEFEGVIERSAVNEDGSMSNYGVSFGVCKAQVVAGSTIFVTGDARGPYCPYQNVIVFFSSDSFSDETFVDSAFYDVNADDSGQAVDVELVVPEGATYVGYTVNTQDSEKQIVQRSAEKVGGIRDAIQEVEDSVEQIQQNTEDISDIKSQLGLIEYDRAAATQNAYINSNGNVTVITEGQYYNAGYCASDFIDVSEFQYIHVSAARRYALYDSNKTKISYAEEVTVNGGAKAISIPATAKYIRITVNEEIDGDFVIRQATKTESTKIAFVGDSITWGYNDNTNEQVEKPYPQIIKEEYGFAECYNMGISGRTLGGDGQTHNTKQYGANPIIDNTYLATIPADADVIVIFAGTNDFGVENYYVPLGELGDQSYMTFYGSLELLCKRLIPLTLGKKLILCTPLHRKAETKIADGVTRNLADYATAIREVAEKYGVEVIDLYSEGEFYAMLTAFQNQYTTSGLHPNQDWYYILARKIGDRIVSRLN